MADGSNPVGAIVENVTDTGGDVVKGIGQELKNAVSTAVGQLTGSQSNPQDPQYQQIQQRDEQMKKVRLKQLRQKLHQEAQMLGAAPPAAPQSKEDEQAPKKSNFESVSLPGSKNTRTDLGLQQSQSFTRAETGRNIKG